MLRAAETVVGLAQMWATMVQELEELVLVLVVLGLELVGPAGHCNTLGDLQVVLVQLVGSERLQGVVVVVVVALGGFHSVA